MDISSKQRNPGSYSETALVPSGGTMHNGELGMNMNQICGLAILPKKSDISTDAQTVIDPESIERFCQIWAEVGRAILARRQGT